MVNDIPGYFWIEEPLTVSKLPSPQAQELGENGRPHPSNVKMSLLTHWARTLKSLPTARTWGGVLFFHICASQRANAILHRARSAGCSMPSAAMGHLDLNPWSGFHISHSTELLSKRRLPLCRPSPAWGPQDVAECFLLFNLDWAAANGIYCI